MATVKKIKKAQFGGPIRKGGSRGGGGCAAYTPAAERAERREGRQAERDYNQQMRQNKRDERKAEKAERKTAPKAQSGKCVSNMSSKQRSRYFQGGPNPLQKAGQAIKNVLTGGKTKEERQEARSERKAARVAKKAPAAKYGRGIKKAQDGRALRDTTDNAKNRKEVKVISDPYKKKVAKNPVPKKKMKHGGTVSMQLGSYGRQPGKNYTGKAMYGTSMMKKGGTLKKASMMKMKKK